MGGYDEGSSLMVKAAALAGAAAVVVGLVFKMLGCLSLPPLVEVAAAVAWAVVLRTRSKGRGYGQGHFSPLVVTTSERDIDIFRRKTDKKNDRLTESKAEV